MPTTASYLHTFALYIDRFLSGNDGRNRFERYAESDVHTIGNAALDATGVIRAGFDDPVFMIKSVVVLRAAHTYSSETRAIFESLAGIDAEHGFTQIGMELVQGRFTQTYWATRNDRTHYPTDGVPILAHRFDQVDHLDGHLWVGATYVVGFGERQIQFICAFLQNERANLAHVSLDVHPVLRQKQFGNGSSSYSGCCFPRRRAASAPVIANAVFFLDR